MTSHEGEKLIKHFVTKSLLPGYRQELSIKGNFSLLPSNLFLAFARDAWAAPWS